MGQRITSTKNTRVGLLAAAVASGMLGVAALGTSPTAAASCASFFGLGSSADCSSNVTSIAIAIGAGATAHADGLFGSAFALGDSISASLTTGTIFGTALAVGTNATAAGHGLAPLAVAIGDNSTAYAGTNGLGPIPGSVNIADFALNVGNQSSSSALGVGSTAVNLGGNGSVIGAIGTLNSAINVGGSNNAVFANLAGAAGSFGTSAFSVFNSGSSVKAGPGPVAIAGAIFQTGASVTKVGPGFNINGIVLGGTAAPSTAAASRGAAPKKATAASAKTGAGDKSTAAHSDKKPGAKR